VLDRVFAAADPQPRGRGDGVGLEPVESVGELGRDAAASGLDDDCTALARRWTARTPLP